MLNNHQKAQLKGLASTLNIKYQVGKNELSDSLITMLDKALEGKTPQEQACIVGDYLAKQKQKAK